MDQIIFNQNFFLRMKERKATSINKFSSKTSAVKYHKVRVTCIKRHKNVFFAYPVMDGNFGNSRSGARERIIRAVLGKFRRTV